MKKLQSLLFLLLFLSSITHIYGRSVPLVRHARQLRVQLGANHEKDDGTDIFAELNSLLWTSADKRTRVDGSAGYNHHFGGLRGDGNPKFSGTLTVYHDFVR